MPAQPPSRPHEPGGGQDARAKAAEGVRARRVDAQVVADGVERSDQVDRVEPEAGRVVADDGCVDADAAALPHAFRSSDHPRATARALVMICTLMTRREAFSATGAGRAQ